MSLTLYSHPLASFCHKVLIALYENGTPFDAVTVDFADPGSAAAHMERWPVGKIPVLHDGAANRVVAETSIIIEYLQRHYPGRLRLLPAEPEARLEVRLWDRFFDLYVHQSMQKVVTDRIRPVGTNDPHGVEEARATLAMAYAMIDGRLADREWVAGDTFTLADCAAVPGLFYGSIAAPFAAEHVNLAAYFERLLARASVRRVLHEARPYFKNFPYLEAMPARFLAAGRRKR